MSIAPYEAGNATDCQAVAAPVPQPRGPLHRLREVRQQQRISLRTVARRLGISVQDAEREESETEDLPLSQLYRWQEALEVPVCELLEDSQMELSSPVRARASLVRVMKTAVTLSEMAHTTRVKSMAGQLIEQLVQIMPELEEVGAWQSSGSRRSSKDLGRAAEYRLDESLLRY